MQTATLQARRQPSLLHSLKNAYDGGRTEAAGINNEPNSRRTDFIFCFANNQEAAILVTFVRFPSLWTTAAAPQQHGDDRKSELK